MSGDKKPPIIKKVIKKGHGGHHGGSWKVAYADFVTAMMAFFLVMWLLAISSQQGKAALAEYFNELTMQDAVFNGGLPVSFTESGAKGPGIMDGGCFQMQNQGESKIEKDVSTELQGFLQASLKAMDALAKALPAGVKGGEGAGDAGKTDLVPSAEEDAFAKELTEAVSNQVGEDMAGQLSVEKVPGGLRIQIVDKDGRPMFESGGPKLTDTAKAILGVVAERLESLDNKISIEGHTDALTMAGQRITNWELSTARASAARLFLAQKGLPDNRLTMVAGYAASQPLDKSNPYDPINRRISIMIWDDGKAPNDLPGTPKTSPAPIAPNASPTPEQPGTAPKDAGTPAVGPVPTPRPNSQSQGGGEPSTRPAARTIAPKKELSPEELEKMLIEETLKKAAAPDLSTVGPPLHPDETAPE